MCLFLTIYQLIVFVKKARERHKVVYRTVRDLSMFDMNDYTALLRAENWEGFNDIDNPDDMWKLLYQRMYDILMIMCPFKRFRQREKLTPWLTPEIYRAMRTRDQYIRLFRATGESNYLKWARISRNKVNAMIYKAKSRYIRTQLRANEKNPKKFWRIIHNILSPKPDLLSSQRFVDRNTNELVNIGEEPDFLNQYFIDIVTNIRIPLSNNLCENVYDIVDRFCFSDDMPTVFEINKLVKDIDVNKSSCVRDINTRFCKAAMIALPDVICSLFTKSLTTGIIPCDWVEGTVTLIPKEGDLSYPENWKITGKACSQEIIAIFFGY